MIATEYEGTYLKYVARTTGDFSLDEHEWKMVFSGGGKKVTFTKRNLDGGAYQLSCDAPKMGMKPCDDGSWVFLIDSGFFGPVFLSAELFAEIPDDDFNPDATFTDLEGVRQEIRKVELIRLASL